MRKVSYNLAAFKGEAIMLTLTGPGGSQFDREVWSEHTLWPAWKRLRDAAAKYAHRQVKGQRSGLLASVPEPHRSGVLHLHIALGGTTVLEKRWCEAFGRYCTKNATRYGFGRQAKLGRTWAQPGSYMTKLARYLSKGASGGKLRRMWETHKLPARSFYVAKRLSDATGCTVRQLARRGQLWSRWRLSVPISKMWEWREIEEELGRQLDRRELAALARSSP
jgi:hypothetical protein